MASDSRLTLNATQSQPGQTQQIVQLAVAQTDSNYKTFLAPTRIGISTCGAADINGVPIAGFIESFINERLAPQPHDVDEVPAELISYFSSLPSVPDSSFHVAGYKVVNGVPEQHVWQVSVATPSSSRLNPPGQQGVSWSGEGDILTRLIKPLAQQDQQGSYQPLPTYPIPYNFFALQDAIDFCIYALRTTIDTIRFQPRAKTVGGPIDVLVIKQDNAFWVQRKELRGTI